MNNNNSVMIGSPRTPGSPRRREAFTNNNYNHVVRMIGSPSFLERLRQPGQRGRYNNSNTNENNIGEIRPRRLNYNRMGGHLNNSATYAKNKTRVERDKNMNNTNRSIKWEKHSMNNLPVDPISLENFKVGEKAVKINKFYLTPKSFRQLARMSMSQAINANGNQVLFNNPMTRGKVKKGDLEFVILKRMKKK